MLKVNDYQCALCVRSYFLYEPIFARYESSHPGAVHHVILDYPLEPEWNDQVSRVAHLGAYEEVVAVRLVRRADRGEQMGRWVCENQSILTRETARQGLIDVADVADFDEPELIEAAMALELMGAAGGTTM